MLILRLSLAHSKSAVTLRCPVGIQSSTKDGSPLYSCLVQSQLDLHLSFSVFLLCFISSLPDLLQATPRRVKLKGYQVALHASRSLHTRNQLLVARLTVYCVL